MNCVFTLDSFFMFVPAKAQKGECLSKPVCFTHTIFLLICVNKTMYLLGNLPFFKIHVNCFMSQDDSRGANIISRYMLCEGPGATLCVLRHFLCLISSLLFGI